MPRILVSVLVTAMILACSLNASAETPKTVTDPNLGFTFKVPPGFAPSDEARDAGKALYVFVREPSRNARMPTLIVIRGLGGTIDREIPTEVKGPDGQPLTVTTLRWKSFEIFGTKVAEIAEGVPCLTFNVEVPIKRERV